MMLSSRARSTRTPFRVPKGSKPQEGLDPYRMGLTPGVRCFD